MTVQFRETLIFITSADQGVTPSVKAALAPNPHRTPTLFRVNGATFGFICFAEAN